jgi:hypothetical protein
VQDCHAVLPNSMSRRSLAIDVMYLKANHHHKIDMGSYGIPCSSQSSHQL